MSSHVPIKPYDAKIWGHLVELLNKEHFYISKKSLRNILLLDITQEYALNSIYMHLEERRLLYRKFFDNAPVPPRWSYACSVLMIPVDGKEHYCEIQDPNIEPGCRIEIHPHYGTIRLSREKL